MDFFKDFGDVAYSFGNNELASITPDISKYVDVIDQIKDDIAFLTYYNIREGDRPDQVSLQIYGTTLYYWTFYLLNDKIRQQGWPLTNTEFQRYIKKIFPNTVLNTRENISTKFKVGQTVTGNTSGASGKIIKRNFMLGQIVIEGEVNFTADGEIVSSVNSQGITETVNVTSSIDERLAASYYTDTSGVVDVGVDSATGNLLNPGVGVNEITNEQGYYAVNESLKQIKVIRPSLITTLIGSYKKALRV
tara:strand:+ start:1430 stop:2173 length:744 start_codon:yes stop_codon:yes gene_type:complete